MRYRPILAAAAALALNISVASAAPLTPPTTPANQAAPLVLVIVCTAPQDGSQTLQCTPTGAAPQATVTSSTTPSPVTPPTTDNVTTTDVRVDTYAKRQAIRDQYRGRINETTFNDELGDGVSLDQALKDAMNEVHLTSTPSR